MPRIRTIKPEFQNSQSMGRVSREARLIFILLWPQCDDEGRLRANSRMLASVLLPYDDDAPKLMDGWLEELQREGCIERYSVDRDEYIEITNFLKHQKVDHPRPSAIPPPREGSRIVANAREDSPLYQGPRTKEGIKEWTKETAPKKARVDIPDWVPLVQWDAFVQMRRQMKSPLSGRAVSLALKELSKLKETGFDPREIIDQSVLNGWKSFYPIKEQGNGNGRRSPTAHDKFLNAAKSLIDEIDEGERLGEDRDGVVIPFGNPLLPS